MKIIKGKIASPGFAIGKVFKVDKTKLDIKKQQVKNYQLEIIKFDQALLKAAKEIDHLIMISQKKIGQKQAAIFEAHKQIALDLAIKEETINFVKDHQVNVDFAYHEITKKYIELFNSNLDNEYMKERVADIKDVSLRVLHHLLEIPFLELANINQDSIIFANDLIPSQTVQLNSFAKGFVTEIGGVTSHSSIMARSLEIPAIVGVGKMLEQLKNGQEAIIDGKNGQVIIEPSQSQKNTFVISKKAYFDQKKKFEKLVNEKSITKDGHQVEIGANIGCLEDLKQAMRYGAEDVGLFRTEFLYMNSQKWPTEEQQFQIYKEVLQKSKNIPIVIRTLDIGGDKTLPYYQFSKEENPFLGYRAIRMCLDQVDIFKTQLKALLKASKYGNLKIMFPMIATIEELNQAKNIVWQVENTLKKQGVSIGKYELGMMMEVPSAAIIADKFASLVDFFSIGTNDLLQYSFACDRMNEKVGYLYQPLAPANLHFIKKIIDAAHQKGKWVGLCGEMAGDPQAIKILLGLGLDCFSMSATSILQARFIVNNSSFFECQKLAHKALACSTEKEVKELLLKHN